MPVVWTERHRGHRPDGGYWLGIREAGDEEPERGDVLRDGSSAAGDEIVDAARPRPRSDHRRARRRVRRLHVPARYRRGSPKAISSIPASRRWCRTCSPPRPSPAGTGAGRRPATIRAELGLYAMDTMTLISEGTFDAACGAVHAAAHAADLVAGGAAAAYAAVRPPGHHAGPAFFGGSCYFNNAAAAAQRLRGADRAGRDRRHRRPPGQRHAGDLLGPCRRAVRERARRSRRRLVPPPRRLRRRTRRRCRRGMERQRAAAPRRRRRAVARGVASSYSHAVERHGSERSWCRSASTPRRTIRRRRWRSPPPASAPPARCSRTLGLPDGVRAGGRLRPRPARRPGARRADRLRGAQPVAEIPPSFWIGTDEAGGIPNPGRPTSTPPPHWRLDAVAATERPRHLDVSPDGTAVAFMLDRDTSDMWTIPWTVVNRDASPPAARSPPSGRTAARVVAGRETHRLHGGGQGRRRCQRAVGHRSCVRGLAPVWIDEHVSSSPSTADRRGRDNGARRDRRRRPVAGTARRRQRRPAARPRLSPDAPRRRLDVLPPRRPQLHQPARHRHRHEASTSSWPSRQAATSDRPAWSPDGTPAGVRRRVAGLVRGVRRLRPTARRRRRQLTDRRADFADCAGRRDGARILAARSRHGVTDLVAIDVGHRRRRRARRRWHMVVAAAARRRVGGGGPRVVRHAAAACVGVTEATWRNCSPRARRRSGRRPTSSPNT